MVELTKEGAKKDLEGLLESEKASVMTPEEKDAKAAEDKKAQEAEDAKSVLASEDEAVLAKTEEERSAEEVERANTILAERKVAEDKKKIEDDNKLPVDEKIQRIKDKTDKRIGEITKELKQLKDEGSQESEILKLERDNLQKENEKLRNGQPVDLRTKIADQESERIQKYADEDRGKDRENRREMPKEELDDWYLEDAVAVTEWLQERRIRRGRAKELDYRKAVAEDLTGKHEESAKRVFLRHPELNLKERARQLKSEGKTDDEIKEVFSNDADLKSFIEISRSNPKYVSSENGPELAVAEFERRKNIVAPEPVQSELSKQVEALTAKIEEMEVAAGARENLDEGVNSVARTKTGEKGKLTVQEQSLVDIMKSEGSAQSSIDSALAKHRAGRK